MFQTIIHFWRRAVPGLLRCLTVSFIILGMVPAQSQSYPTRPITLIVPFPPGGGNDAMARIIADKLSVTLGQQVVVDNRGRAGGLIGTRAVVRAPDGYTLLLGHTGTLGINPSLYAPNTGYDIRMDFAPIGLIAVMPMAFMDYPPTPCRTIADLIAAKKEPGKINIGSSPKGTGSHLCAELFTVLSGAKMNLMPYKGTAQRINDLVGGHVAVACNILPPAFGNIKAGTLRPLAVTSGRRSPLLPGVPTVSESGLPGLEAELYYGLLAEIIDTLNSELCKALAADEVRQRIAADAAVPMSSTPEEQAALLDRDEAKWAALIGKLGLRVE